MMSEVGGISLFAQILNFLLHKRIRKSKVFIIIGGNRRTNFFSLASYSNSPPKNICLNLGKCGEKSIGLQMYFFAFALLFLSIAGASVLRSAFNLPDSSIRTTIQILNLHYHFGLISKRYSHLKILFL